MKKMMLGVALAATMTGCASQVVGFTMLSNKSIDLSRAAEFKRGTAPVSAEDTVHIIVIIPTGAPDAGEALSRALASVPGAVALLDGTISSEIFYIPYIYGYSKYVVEGTPLIDPRLQASKTPVDGSYHLVVLDRHGDVKQVKPLTHDEFDAMTRKG